MDFRSYSVSDILLPTNYVSSWWLLFPSRSSVLINIYIYIYALLYEFCFLWFTNCVLLSDDDSLIPGCLWLLAFVLNNTLILGIWCYTIPHRWINHLPPACGSTFWKSIFKHQLGFRFDILNSISSFYCILTYAIIYVLVHHIIFWLYLYFLNILYFFKYSCTNIFYRRSICTFYSIIMQDCSKALNTCKCLWVYLMAVCLTCC